MRAMPARKRRPRPAALVQVVETGEHSATARALYVCHEIQVGDRLEFFPARVELRDARRQLLALLGQLVGRDRARRGPKLE